MSSTFRIPLHSLRLALPILALAIAVACGGLAWLLTVPAMFLLGRWYGDSHGRRPEPHDSTGNAEYGIGAALTGFTPDGRK
ncbi:hypothetical protein [Pseudoduganella lutea]|uniref:Uncharacterized protein n=1 Tax=Pseudoduganella lutea TaxID=321985 RepID=A0A4P6L1W8_9BURK|nr:hypothetical protein [Pseudoduganella lutea]QBE64882.1 hypothetical protein EWM63_19340 [Pseudoduganella lutea]